MATTPQVILALVHEACLSEDKSLNQLVYNVVPIEEENGEQVMNRYLAIQELEAAAKRRAFKTIVAVTTFVPHEVRVSICAEALANASFADPSRRLVQRSGDSTESANEDSE